VSTPAERLFRKLRGAKVWRKVERDMERLSLPEQVHLLESAVSEAVAGTLAAYCAASLLV
jgi:hypothetical protein